MSGNRPGAAAAMPSVTLTTPNNTGVTVNSNNDLVNNGQIVVNNINGATGVRILPGFTGSYSGSGAITLLEDYTRTDTDNDSDLDIAVGGFGDADAQPALTIWWNGVRS